MSIKKQARELIRCCKALIVLEETGGGDVMRLATNIILDRAERLRQTIFAKLYPVESVSAHEIAERKPSKFKTTPPKLRGLT